MRSRDRVAPVNSKTVATLGNDHKLRNAAERGGLGPALRARYARRRRTCLVNLTVGGSRPQSRTLR